MATRVKTSALPSPITATASCWVPSWPRKAQRHRISPAGTLAQLLGVHRHAIGHRLALYEVGGLEPLLVLYVPVGKPLSLPPAVLAALEQVLRQPAGFAS
jgi:hypothetical protein